MSKKGTKALASATLMSLVLTTALSAGPVKAAAGQAERIGAADRYATAAQVATKNWTTSENVVLVSGEGYADAVSASALAKKLNAPILLTTAKTLSTDTASALSKLGAKNVYVVGGEASVSTAVRTELKKTYSLVELGGANRYETNVAVAQKLVDLGVKADEVIMVGGEGFSDALSVAPVAAAKGQILLLGMNNADYMKPVLDFVKKNNSKVTVVGTKNVISDSILSTVKGTRVDGGKDRWDTNQKVLANFKDTVKMDKLYVASAAYNAQDNGYADALVASALAGKFAAPLVLVDKDGNEGTTNALAYIKANAKKTTDLQVVGGTGVVSEGLLGQITSAVNPNGPTGDTTVKTIEATSLNQIKIVFGTDVDSDSAEDVGNYKLDGTTLDSTKAVASLGDDNRTLLITLKDKKEQQKDYTVSVKNGVLSADKSKNITAFEQKVTFSDVTAPTVASVSVKGNNKLTVKFSEPVKMDARLVNGKYRPDASGNSNFTSKFKINGQNITSFGLSKDDSEVKNAIATTGSSVWADQVDFYFSTKLPAGNNTLKVSDGDTSQDVLVDSAGFIIKEKTQDFNVDAVSTKPVVKEVKADPDNTIWVRFDRPMDSKTATVITNYTLKDKDGNNALASATAKLKEGDCTVKIQNAKNIPFGSNSMYISDSVKDAYGNKVDDDTRVSFTMTKDESKPTVTNVNMVDSETIRVTFSKDIDATYATNVNNYTLKDASGVDISKHIKVVKPANMTVKDSTTSGSIFTDYPTLGNDKVWDIKMIKNGANGEDWRLTNSKYSLTIKYLIDTTANKNQMDEYNTTLNGSDDVNPKMKQSSYIKDNGKKMVVLFTEAMDSDTLNKIDNYKYKNGDGDSKTLPSDTKITVGNDNKSVTFELPSNYKVMTKSDSDSNTTLGADNKVIGIVGSNLKDQAGNLIDSFNNYCDVTGAPIAGGLAYKDYTYRIDKDVDDILVKLQFNNAIDEDTAIPANFNVEGLTPDSVSISGSDIVLRYNKDSKATLSDTINLYYSPLLNNQANLSGKASKQIDKADIIKLKGANARVYVTSAVRDVAGNSISNPSNPVASTVYDYLAAPKTTSDYWYATTSSGITVDSVNTSAVVLTFDTYLDSTYSGVKPDDFTFIVGGTELKADKAVVKGNAVIFLFKDVNGRSVLSASQTVNVTLKNKTGIDVRALRDDNKNNAKYVPSSDDNSKTREVTVSGTAQTLN